MEEARFKRNLKKKKLNAKRKNKFKEVIDFFLDTM